MLNLEDTYKQFGERVFNIALQYLRNVEDAEEVTQDVFLTVYKKQSHFAHFLDIQKICKPEQQDDFALLTKDLSKMFRGRGPKGNADGGQESKRDGGSKSEAP